MENVKNVELIEHILKNLAQFHGEPNLKFYKELSEELFVRYADFEDTGAGYATLQALIHKNFGSVSRKKFISDWIKKNFDDSIEVEWFEEKAVLTDEDGEQMEVEMRDNVLYADGKPMSSIPSLA